MRRGRQSSRGSSIWLLAVRFWSRWSSCESSGGAEAELRWQPPALAEQVVPMANLYPLELDSNVAPEAVITASVQTGFAPLTVQFDGSQSFDPNGGSISYQWSFGDGATSTSESPSHLYSAAGVYEVALTVTDALGWVGSAETSIEVFDSSVAEGGLLAEYFDGRNFEESKLVRVDSQIDFDWADGSPAPTVASDSFSVRWQGFLKPEFSETYEIVTTTNNGARLWIDGVLLVDHWTSDAPWPAVFSIPVVLQAGQLHAIRFEMFEGRGSASASLEWSAPSVPREVVPPARLFSQGVSNLPPTASMQVSPLIAPAGVTVAFDAASSSDPEGEALSFLWDFGDGAASDLETATHVYSQAGTYTVTLSVVDSAGQSDSSEVTVVATPGSPGGGAGEGLLGTYFSERNLSGGSLTRIDPVLDFSWGTAAPDPSLPADDFSVRWLGWIKPEFDETYNLITKANNGVRLWLDGQLLIDRWTSAGPWPATVVASASLQGGSFHFVQIDFYEASGGAEMQLDWESPSQSREVIPTGRLYPAQSGNRSPIAVATASRLSVRLNAEVQFDASGSWDPDGDAMQYRWRLKDQVISTGASPTLSFDRPGTHEVTMCVTDRIGFSDLARLTVEVAATSSPPQPRITSSGAPLDFESGELITVMGEAWDEEDGWLGDESVEWQIDILAAGEIQSGVVRFSGLTGAFQLPDLEQGESARLCLTAFDSESQSAQTCIWLSGAVIFDSDFEGGAFEWSSESR